jgi:glycerol kinase
MMHILSIDQSTSATKAIIFNARGELLGKVSRRHEQIYPQPGWVEHDAEELWNNTLAVIEDIAQTHPDLIANVGWISISNQRETALAFDRASGRPLGNAIVWQCRRGTDLCDRLTRVGHGDYVTKATGLKLDPYFSGSKLKWMVDNHADLAARLNDGSALVGTIDAYLVYRLTRQQVFATDSTNACRTLLFNIHNLEWDDALCELFSIPRWALPEVRDSHAYFGQSDAAGRLPREIPVCGVMGDSQASLFALGCYQTGDAKITFGTGSSLLLNIGNRPPPCQAGTVATLAWVRDGVPTYCLEGIVNCSAATIEWLKNRLQLIEGAAETDGLARSVPDHGGVYLVPAFVGLSAPYWNPHARAAIVGMSAHTTKAHVVRAALESIAYQIRDVIEMMQAETGVAPTRIQADGGATANEFLMQFTADVLQATLQTSQVAESSPLGAALCGALGQGVYQGLDDVAQLAKVAQTYAPQMDREQADRLYGGWKEAVQRVL